MVDCSTKVLYGLEPECSAFLGLVLLSQLNWCGEFSGKAGRLGIVGTFLCQRQPAV